MKTYSVDSKAMYWLFVAGLPCFVVAFGSFWLWGLMHDASPGDGLMWFGVVWMLLVLWGCYRQVTMPHSIEVTDSGTIRFVGAFQTSSVEPAEVISVRTRPGPFIEVRHTHGKTYLLQQVTGFHEFLIELRRANPSVSIRGL